MMYIVTCNHRLYNHAALMINGENEFMMRLINLWCHPCWISLMYMASSVYEKTVTRKSHVIKAVLFVTVCSLNSSCIQALHTCETHCYPPPPHPTPASPSTMRFLVSLMNKLNSWFELLKRLSHNLYLLPFMHDSPSMTNNSPLLYYYLFFYINGSGQPSRYT